MKKILLLATALIAAASSWAQYDKGAKDVLDAVSAKMQGFTTIKADIIVTHENIQEKIKESFNGTMLLKGSKYKLDIMGRTIQNDGKTMWTFTQKTNEVNISNVADADNLLSNPLKIFSMYKKGFKYKFIGERYEKGRAIQTVELYPEKVEDAEYSRIQMQIDKDKKQIYIFTYVGKDANRYQFEITKMTTNQPAEDAVFVFDKSKHPKVEIIDLRD